MDKLKRLVMLGTPNFGSFAPAMVFRGGLSVSQQGRGARSVARPGGSCGDLRDISGVDADAAPSRQVQRDGSLRREKWPSSGARPVASCWQPHRPCSKSSRSIAAKFVMMAGVDQRNHGRLARGEERVRVRTLAGRRRNGAPGFRGPPKRADLLPGGGARLAAKKRHRPPRGRRYPADSGETSLLADHWDATRGDAIVDRCPKASCAPASMRRGSVAAADDRVRPAQHDGRAGRARDLRRLPVSRAPARRSLTGRRRRVRRAGHRRQRQRRIDVRLARGSITQVKNRAYVLGLVRECRARRCGVRDRCADGRRDQRISPAPHVHQRRRRDLRRAWWPQRRVRRFHGVRGSRAISTRSACRYSRPSPRTSPVPWRGSTSKSSSRCRSARAPGSTSSRRWRRCSAGSSAGSKTRTRCSRSARSHCAKSMSALQTLKWVLYRLSSTELCDERGSHAERAAPAARARHPARRRAGLPPSIYLTVRATPEGGNLRIESALLTTGAKAAVMSGQVSISKQSSTAPEVHRDAGFSPRNTA